MPQGLEFGGPFHTLNPTPNRNLLSVSFLESKSRITSRNHAQNP